MVPGSYHIKTHLRVDDPMYMIGTYKGDGKVLVLPIKGSGACNITTVHMHRIRLRGMTSTASNALSVQACATLLDPDNMNKFLNEIMDLLVEDLKPAMELALAATDMDVARRLFSKVPYNSVFPPS
ncbi:protein takeout-like [Schistocerca americana]|uniref:protein takeout-like n=1 Tax=Schistocerca americana TaxID=7009 RepID=UPI001F503818|nr:protein takeout-like [Schistocerca americana]